MLTDEQCKVFGEKFLERFLSHGFGAMTKSEIDILVFHLISDSAEIKGKTNYEIANTLRITESRVKSLRLNASMRYAKSNHKAVLNEIIARITNEMQRPEFVTGSVRITIENPVEQRELEHAIKQAGRNVEYGLNREILEISPIALFEVVVSNLEKAEEEFKQIIQSQISDQQKQDKIINNTLTLRQKINRVGEEISDKAGLISLLAAAGAAL